MKKKHTHTQKHKEKDSMIKKTTNVWPKHFLPQSDLFHGTDTVPNELKTNIFYEYRIQ